MNWKYQLKLHRQEQYQLREEVQSIDNLPVPNDLYQVLAELCYQYYQGHMVKLRTKLQSKEHRWRME